jgi:hypothetical protein
LEKCPRDVGTALQWRPANFASSSLLSGAPLPTLTNLLDIALKRLVLGAGFCI